MLLCPDCKTVSLRRTTRTWKERVSGDAAAYACASCGSRHTTPKVKHCWRCGTDLDRRRRQNFGDYVAAILILWPYSCRRCGSRRYRWGKHSG